jgi:hypothetical protein
MVFGKEKRSVVMYVHLGRKYSKCFENHWHMRSFSAEVGALTIEAHVGGSVAHQAAIS